MTLITTAVVDQGTLRTWQIPQGLTGVPRGEIIYHGQNPVAAKINTDTSLYTLSCRLPINFAYRLMDLDLIVQSETVNAFQDWEPAAEFELNNGGLSLRVGAIWRESVDSGSNTTDYFVWLPSTSKDVMANYLLRPGRFSAPFLADAGVPALSLRLSDPSGDSTPATSVIHHCRFLQYTIDQYNSYVMQSPVPVVE